MVMTSYILFSSLQVSFVKAWLQHIGIILYYIFAIQRTDQQEKHHLGACKKYRISGKLRLNQDLHFIKTVGVHTGFLEVLECIGLKILVMI